MENLIRFLQNNPIIILVMFIISVLSGIMTIIFGWKRFRDDILLKKITIPVYAYLLIFFVVVLIILFLPAIEDLPKPIKTIEGETFGVQRIVLDGKRFVNCKFRRTELIFRGEGPVGLEHCELENIRLSYDKYAVKTLFTLMKLYADPGVRPIVEDTLQKIRKGKFPKATIPSGAADG